MFCKKLTDKIVTKLWEIKEISIKNNNLTRAEKYCEDYFERRQNETGRFLIIISFKNNFKKLDSSLR